MRLAASENITDINIHFIELMLMSIKISIYHLQCGRPRYYASTSRIQASPMRHARHWSSSIFNKICTKINFIFKSLPVFKSHNAVANVDMHTLRALKAWPIRFSIRHHEKVPSKCGHIDRILQWRFSSHILILSDNIVNRGHVWLYILFSAICVQSIYEASKYVR